MATKNASKTQQKMVATNKQARRNYLISETFEAGIVLRGAEVKSLRESKVTINEAYARFESGELYVIGLHIAPYSRAGTLGIADPTRKRKLLMHKYELRRLNSKVDIEQLTLVPMAIYFKEGRAKIEIGLGKGMKTVDKRQAIAKRDSDRDARRELSDRTKYAG
ncbi:MAG: SsrA-binding protein SmpB [Acidimicrobiales bacterium]